MPAEGSRRPPAQPGRRRSKRPRHGPADAALPLATLSEPFRVVLADAADPSRRSRASWQEVGIDEFVSDGQPVAAFLKQRFSDFVVQ